MKKCAFIITWVAFTLGCNQHKEPLPAGAELQHRCEQILTDVIVHDIYSPPVASRIYAYANLAYYEALAPSFKGNSLLLQLKGFDNLTPPSDGTEINFRLSAVTAFMKVAEALVFSKDSIRIQQKDLTASFELENNEAGTSSLAWGDAVAKNILKRAGADGYKKTRGMPRYSVFEEEGRWQQTPPDYNDATEPNWKLIQPLLMDSAAQFKPIPPPSFSMEEGSTYRSELDALYNTCKSLSEEQKTIARYWDDNPFVSAHVGHLTYATKKTTPVGHWMGITAILCKTAKKDEVATAKAYAMSAAAIFDGFISCWDEKFRSRTSRPVTVIRQHIESEWNPLLQTPSFPEYTSGHSVISGAASAVLIHQFGNGFAFHDTTEMKYLGMERSFPSIEAATDEIGISRFYGGIHFMSAITQGKKQGEHIGNLFNQLNIPL